MDGYLNIMAIERNNLPAVLLVDDDEVDMESFVRALKKSNIPNPVYCASDGVEAMDYLDGTNGKEKLAQPCVVFLDINMPRMNGFEFLEEMRTKHDMRQNIVFMLTTSTRQSDIDTAYHLNVAGYIVKSNLLDLAVFLEKYFVCNEFPTQVGVVLPKPPSYK